MDGSAVPNSVRQDNSVIFSDKQVRQEMKTKHEGEEVCAEQNIRSCDVGNDTSCCDTAKLEESLLPMVKTRTWDETLRKPGWLVFAKNMTAVETNNDPSDGRKQQMPKINKSRSKHLKQKQEDSQPNVFEVTIQNVDQTVMQTTRSLGIIPPIVHHTATVKLHPPTDEYFINDKSDPLIDQATVERLGEPVIDKGTSLDCTSPVGYDVGTTRVNPPIKKAERSTSVLAHPVNVQTVYPPITGTSTPHIIIPPIEPQVPNVQIDPPIKPKIATDKNNLPFRQETTTEIVDSAAVIGAPMHKVNQSPVFLNVAERKSSTPLLQTTTHNINLPTVHFNVVGPNDGTLVHKATLSKTNLPTVFTNAIEPGNNVPTQKRATHKANLSRASSKVAEAPNMFQVSPPYVSKGKKPVSPIFTEVAVDNCKKCKLSREGLRSGDTHTSSTAIGSTCKDTSIWKGLNSKQLPTEFTCANTPCPNKATKSADKIFNLRNPQSQQRTSGKETNLVFEANKVPGKNQTLLRFKWNLDAKFVKTPSGSVLKPEKVIRNITYQVPPWLKDKAATCKKDLPSQPLEAGDLSFDESVAKWQCSFLPRSVVLGKQGGTTGRKIHIGRGVYIAPGTDSNVVRDDQTTSENVLQGTVETGEVSGRESRQDIGGPSCETVSPVLPCISKEFAAQAEIGTADNKDSRGSPPWLKRKLKLPEPDADLTMANLETKYQKFDFQIPGMN